MTEQEAILQCCQDIPTIVTDWSAKLPQLYKSYNAAYFDNALPPLSAEFVCEFQDLSRENAGIYIDAERARKLSTDQTTVRPGIRIHSSLKVLKQHVEIALLHEMIHATGIKGHGADFKRVLDKLIAVGAYCELL